MTLHHNNGNPVAKLYSDTDYEDCDLQGGIVTFNILRSNGDYVGYMEVLNMAALYKIQLRTGCFCNPGACQRHLNLSNLMIVGNYEAGYVCGGSKDLIDGKPTGCVRISFGYMSSIKDVEKLLKMIRNCFLDKPEVIKIPTWWKQEREKFRIKYKTDNYIEDKIEISDNIQINIQNRNINIENRDQSEISNIKNSGVQIDNIQDSDGVQICDTRQKDMIKKDVTREKKLEIEEKIPRRVDYANRIRLERLFIYPIKSCAAFEISDSWILNSRGLQFDREWMIVTTAGVCLTQKQEVNLCLIKPHLDFERNKMELSFPGN